MRKPIVLISILILPAISQAGVPQKMSEYGPVNHNSRAVTGWATSCNVTRGLVKAGDPSLGYATAGAAANGTGPADNIVVSLGDGGMATLGFSEPISDKQGPDFAVFENSFDGKFLELAFVEVSTDSVRWVRFPAKSLTQAELQTNGFGTTDPDMIINLAGKYRAFSGTPFDLNEIADSSGIDINAIRYVRIVDVVGSIDPAKGSRDSEGRMINDPWPTPFPSSGFDLDAVAVLEPGLLGIDEDGSNTGVLIIYPVPAGIIVNVVNPWLSSAELKIISGKGEPLHTASVEPGPISIDISFLAPGTYIALLRRDDGYTINRKFIKY
jgi:hypothetical protein